MKRQSAKRTGDPDFSDLAPFVEEWGLPTTEDRMRKRLNSTFEELESFHAAMMPRLEEIIQFLNQYRLDEIPARYEKLANAALAMCEVDDPVSKWRTVTLPEAGDPRRFISKRSFYDNRPKSSGID
ncbi:MAG: hypothetical protein RIC93_03090 [Alphaproteobacteria bacterium]